MFSFLASVSVKSRKVYNCNCIPAIVSSVIMILSTACALQDNYILQKFTRKDNAERV